MNSEVLPTLCLICVQCSVIHPQRLVQRLSGSTKTSNFLEKKMCCLICLVYSGMIPVTQNYIILCGCKDQLSKSKNGNKNEKEQDLFCVSPLMYLRIIW